MGDHIRVLLPRSTEGIGFKVHEEVDRKAGDVAYLRGANRNRAVSSERYSQVKCPICSGEMEKVFSLPGYPFTDKPGVGDQGFLFCECGHGMLEKVYPQESGRMGEDHYLNVFADFIKRHADHYDLVIDIGGNDGSLANRFNSAYEVIDPSVNCGIEEVILTRFKFTHKLYVSSHTLEHVEDPNLFISKVSRSLRYEDTVALQVPSLECLVEDFRFDQIHHQHIHYFSERSLTALLAKHGLEVIASEFNYDHWGALMVVAKPGKGHASGKKLERLDVLFSRFIFTTNMGTWRYKLRNGGFVAFGASPMLPVMDYHLPLEKADFIADDDRSKEGFWRNKVVTSDYSLKDRDVVITASSKVSTRKLTSKALSLGARNVYTPFQ